MRRVGYILLQISAYLILVGGIADLGLTFFADALPESHLKYLNIKNQMAPIELKNLDFALLRAIGGCLIGISIGALTIIYSGIRNKIKYTLLGLLTMVTISEGINFSQMLKVNSPYFAFPVVCVSFLWLGAILWHFGNKTNTN